MRRTAPFRACPQSLRQKGLRIVQKVDLCERRPEGSLWLTMSGFGQFCPVAVTCEIFAQRWTPIIVRELLAGSHRFNQLQRGIPRISRALLAQRLRELEGAGIVTSVPLSRGSGREYHLTDAGKEFRAVIEGLGTWGQRWTVRVDPRNLDAGFLMWNIRRRVALDRLPPGRTVVRFDFRGVPAAYRGPRKFWLLLERPEPDLCRTDPGFEVDLYVDAELAVMAKVWLGDLPFEHALRSNAVQLMGPRALVRTFPSWLLLSPVARVPRAAARTG
jgi:DNA-binding HxlR family transcriptional regulator